VGLVFNRMLSSKRFRSRAKHYDSKGKQMKKNWTFQMWFQFWVASVLAVLAIMNALAGYLLIAIIDVSLAALNTYLLTLSVKERNLDNE